VTLPNGTFKRYFLKVSCTSNSPSAPIFDLHLQTATGNSSRALAEREFYSICAIDAVVPELVPKAVGWGQYQNHKSQDVYFFLDNFHDMVLLEEPPDPAHFMSQIAETHQKGTSPNGMFGFQVATVCGIMERTVTWEQSWAKSFTHQLKDVIKYDNETNGPWPEYDAACKQFIDVVTPRLLGVLQSDGREIKPSLIHGDLWEQNKGIDMETKKAVLFDAGCTYAHNKMEFGTWRCSWAMYFRGQKYIRLYKSYNQASEPENE
jgi:protein-ribulosamine 3-kinase